mmetsp:Transcript_25510/g.60123  ORF Transcript_25510/g.60123 Transcript_25510/m.60123 type:complete len:81 (-) Transcript_25510:1852-2094(-)
MTNLVSSNLRIDRDPSAETILLQESSPVVIYHSNNLTDELSLCTLLRDLFVSGSEGFYDIAVMNVSLVILRATSSSEKDV